MDIDAKYQAIKELAISDKVGASADQVYHWKLRGKMPYAWQVKVWKAAGSSIEFADMEKVFDHFKSLKEKSA